MNVWLSGSLVGALLVCGPVQAAEVEAAIAQKFEEWSLPVPHPGRVIVCHGFNCRYRTEIGLHKGDHVRLAGMMAAGRASPAAERRAVATAVAWLARRVAPEAGTAKARARANGIGDSGDPSQFDCIDTTTNTTTYLVVLERLGLLQHHRIQLPVSRHFFIDGGLHTTAVLAERKSGRRWAIDPWTHNNGELPDVLPVDVWQQQT
jgi:hypothetical protein